MNDQAKSKEELLKDLRALRQAHDELKKSYEKILLEVKLNEEMLLQLFKAVNTTSDAIFLTNTEGIITYVNYGFTALYGYTADEVVGKVTPRIIKSGMLEKEIYEKFWEKLKNKSEVKVEILNKRKNGELVFVDVTASPILDEKNAIIGFLGIQRDNTERKQMEEALRESEAKYQAIFESTGTTILIVEEDTTILMANSVCYSLTGYTPNELVGQKWIQYVAPESLHEVLNNHQLRRQNPDLVPRQYEVKLVNKKGEKRDAILNVGMIQNTKQSVVSILDITELKQTEDSLRLSEEKYRTLTENIGEGVGFSNEEEKFVYANPSAEKIFGVGKGELIGLYISTFLIGENFEIIKNETQKRRQGKSSVYETEIVLKDGSKKDILITATPSFHNNKFIGTFAIFRDITEQKQALEEIQRKNKELQIVNAEKDKFFSIIAHDLRNPFNAFLGFTHMMAEDIHSMTMDEIQKMGLLMKESATNLYGLLENLLEWSLMQRGVTTFSPASFLLMPKISENIAFAVESAKKKNIIIRCDVPEDLIVFADANMLGSVIRNLFSNAVKFTPKGGKIIITAKPVSENSVEISIKDTGTGMNNEMVGNLFQLDINTSRKGTEGELSTGLGLIICKEFIEKSGGIIRVESEEGKGSTFSFTIPQGHSKIQK